MGKDYHMGGYYYILWDFLYDSGIIMIAKCDEKGRLYIPKKFRSKIGREVFLIELKDGLLIVPVPEDPIEELMEIGEELPDIPMDELKRSIEEEALDEIMGRKSGGKTHKIQ